MQLVSDQNESSLDTKSCFRESFRHPENSCFFFPLTPHIDKSKLLQWMKEEAKYVLLLFFGFYFGWTYPLMTKLRIILSVESKQVARQISD